jgi:hypothetical protein
MATYKVAHLHEQGVDMIIVPLSSSFGNRSNAEQSEIIAGLEMCASSAGLSGTVIPVWREGSGHRFIAPQPWHPFFRSFSYGRILANINRELTCG